MNDRDTITIRTADNNTIERGQSVGNPSVRYLRVCRTIHTRVYGIVCGLNIPPANPHITDVRVYVRAVIHRTVTVNPSDVAWA